jgi:hypothetical protein
MTARNPASSSGAVGQRRYGPANGGTYLDRARAAWKPAPPDWVETLAREADKAASQTELGKRLGVSGAAVSATIGHNYAGRYDALEARVKGALMRATVECPVEGVIGRDRCAANQRHSPTAANPVRARLVAACKSCPNRFAP